jgi:ABC-2 type transport system ATP-binding protein
MSRQPPMLEVAGLSHRYGDFVALQSLDLEVRSGECVALIGHNGSGKTTAVRMIAGLLEPTSGTVTIDGSDMHDPDGSVLARAALAFVPDNPLLYGDLTAREHLELVIAAHGVTTDHIDERIERMLSLLEIDQRGEAFPGQLSRGMRQKLMLACALLRPYLVLVLDEPVVGLDPAAQLVLRDLLLDAKADGKAVLFTTHQLAFADGIADRAVLLSDGVVIEQGPYAQVISGERVYERGLR